MKLLSRRLAGKTCTVTAASGGGCSFFCELGCNAHIVRLPQNQLLTNFDPRGVDFVNFNLIFNQTSNVRFILYLCTMEWIFFPWKINTSKNALKLKIWGSRGNSRDLPPEKEPSDTKLQNL